MTGIAIGLATMIVSEAATLARVEPFWSWNTPIAWTGFILFTDSIVYRARRRSWLRSAPAEFAALALVSIPLWLVFEFYNLYLHNWHYVGLPENLVVRNAGYAWAFATIWPAIFEAADLIAVWRRTPAVLHPVAPPPAATAVSLLAGAAMVLCPFVVSPAVARYLAAPVWLGFIFLLDPINDRLGAESLTGDLRHGRADRLINLLLSGLLCGLLWEFWNYWSRTKWHYTVPILEHVKLFEMPLPGYLGFPAFAVECFTMYVCLRAVAARLASRSPRELGRTIAL